jgi:hypothetical protein
MSSIDDQLTILYVLVDDFCRARPALAAGRHSPHQRPLFSDAAVLTIALLQAVPKMSINWPCDNLH